MDDNSENRNLGRQPLADILDEMHISAHDLVEAAPVNLTHKMVARAAKGRRLTRHSQELVRAALEKVSGKDYPLQKLFNY